MVIQRELSFSTKGQTDIVNLTPLIGHELANLEVSNGIVSVFVPGATGGVTTIEYEPGLVNDFREMIEDLIPQGKSYQHNQKWQDGNAHSHLRASLMGPELTVPLINKQLSLGAWQQVIFVDFDVRPRHRTIVLQVIGE